VRKWIKSACAVLAWSIMPILVAVGAHSSVRPAQATQRIVSSTTQVTLTAFTTVAQPAPAVRYVVQPGDTLSGIASALSVRGGWQALYAANRQAIGPNPNIIPVGTVLAMPGGAASGHYAVAPGDTLSGIAAALGIRGGWQALYAANRQAIGPNPNIIRAGTVLTAPVVVVQARPPSRARPGRAPAAPSAPAGQGRRPAPVTVRAASVAPASVMPRWLKSMLLAAGIVIGLALVSDPVIVTGRRRMRGRGRQRAARKAGIIVADYERLIVTYSLHDDTVYVLTPPDEDPRAVLRAARLVVPERKYQELAGQLGVSANWPLE
jgi:LysM repeat protein